MTTTISAPDWPSDTDLDRDGVRWVESVLRGALARIRFGWHQGGYFADLDGQDTTANTASAYCLLGAIDAETAARGLGRRVARRAKRQVALVLGDPSPRMDALVTLDDILDNPSPETDAIAEFLGNTLAETRAIAGFNDAPGRAKDEVIAVLRRSLEALESE